MRSSKILLCLLVLGFCRGAGADAAVIRQYGLESVRLENVYDPDPRPEHLLLVSGSLKFTGRNVWEVVTHIPQRTAAPRTDRGIYSAGARAFRFYSLLTFSTYTGRLTPDGERLVITKTTRDGRRQTETWYRVR